MKRDELQALAAIFDERCEGAAIEDALRAMRDPTSQQPVAVVVYLHYAQLDAIRAALRACAEEAPHE